MGELVNFTNTERVLKEYAAAAEDLYKDKLLESKRVASGGLIDSVSCIVVLNGARFAVEMHLAECWKYVEWDTKPHFPPHLPIFEWVKAKPLLPTNEGKIRTRGKNKGLPYTREELQHGIAYAVQHKIAKHGTKGSHDMQRTTKALNDTYEELIAEAVAQDFGAAVDVVLRVFAR